MMEMEGIIDFDLVQTVIMMDDDQNFDPERQNNKNVNAMKQKTPTASGPQKFRIEVKGP